MRINKKGFTLLEILVVVLIIGILAAIALPQYQTAVTKAKVASMLPLMRRWQDALMVYNLQYGSYCLGGEAFNDHGYCDHVPDGSDLGVSWPSDWKTNVDNPDPCGDKIECVNDYWHCSANINGNGWVECEHQIGSAYYNNGNAVFSHDYGSFYITMTSPPYFEEYKGIMCSGEGSGVKICKALGGKLIEGDETAGIFRL